MTKLDRFFDFLLEYFNLICVAKLAPFCAILVLSVFVICGVVALFHDHVQCCYFYLFKENPPEASFLRPKGSWP